MTAPHPRFSFNSVSSTAQSLADDLAMCSELGIRHFGVVSPKLEEPGWDAGARAVRDSGLHVSSMSCYPHEAAKALEFTASVGGDLLYLVTGGADGLEWEEAADRYCERMAPLVSRAGELGVKLAIEPTSPLRCDVSFIFNARDAVDLARRAGVGLCLDFYSCWYERGLAELVRKNSDLLELVQICDFKFGTRETGIRCPVGEGDLPVERLLGHVLDAGYAGVFELEILGPEIAAEGYRAPVARSLERTSEILSRLGA